MWDYTNQFSPRGLEGCTIIKQPSPSGLIFKDSQKPSEYLLTPPPDVLKLLLSIREMYNMSTQTENQAAYDIKFVKQLRLIRRFAKIHHVDLDTGLTLWVSTGCAARWGNSNLVK